MARTNRRVEDFESNLKVNIRDLNKVYKGQKGDVTALQKVNLGIKPNEFVCVIGPSGCGKSTLLNIIAGLESKTYGSIKVDGKEISGPDRNRGVVFQEYALFPWKTVIKNVEFGLKLRGFDKQTRKDKAKEYLELVGLSDFVQSYPKELSGGMKQRVAIARAYANNPEILLMDEPFGALDAQSRVQLQEELLSAWESQRKTCFFITHDVEEAILLGQKIVIMSARPGRIKEIVDVNIPYPRTQEVTKTKDFFEIKNDIWAKVYHEYMSTKK